MKFLSLDTCDSLSELALSQLVARHGHQFHALNLGGHSKLLEYFWMSGIPRLDSVRVLVMGVAEDCCPKVEEIKVKRMDSVQVTAKIHIDQFIGKFTKAETAHS